MQKIVAVLGSLGSGKTTIVNRLIALTQDQEGVVVIVNDVGEKNIDADRISGASQVRPLTAGCIGCSDLASFQLVLQEAALNPNIGLVIIEPTGIADGNEIRAACQDRPLGVLTLIDVAHFDRNQALRCMESQLGVADIVALTWVNGTAVPDKVFDFIGRFAPGKQILTDIEEEKVLSEVLSRLCKSRLGWLAGRYVPHQCSEHCDHPHHHHEYHSPHEHHDHGVYSHTFRFREDLQYAEFVEVVAPYLADLVRAKGVIAGQTFDFVQGDISLDKKNGACPHGNFIFSRDVDVSDIRARAEPTLIDTRPKKERMSDGEGIPLVHTLVAIEWQLSQYPAVLSPTGKLRVDCEADVAYQLAKRHEVPMSTKKQVLKRYIGWRLESVKMLVTRDWSHVTKDEVDYWKRRLGVVLGHDLTHSSQYLSLWMCMAMQRTHPAHLLAEGLLGLKELSFLEERAEERPEVVVPLLWQGRGCHDATPDLVTAAIEHCELLAAERPDWHKRWERANEKSRLEQRPVRAWDAPYTMDGNPWGAWLP